MSKHPQTDFVIQLFDDYFNKYYDTVEKIKDDGHPELWLMLHDLIHLGSRVATHMKELETGKDLGTFWNFKTDGGVAEYAKFEEKKHENN
jgi:hypothetical protein